MNKRRIRDPFFLSRFIFNRDHALYLAFRYFSPRSVFAEPVQIGNIILFANRLNTENSLKILEFLRRYGVNNSMLRNAEGMNNGVGDLNFCYS